MAITPEARMAMRAKALDRREKKLGKRIHPDKELLAKYINRPPTLETLFEVIREGQRTPENASMEHIYFLRHLADTPAERKLAMKATIALLQGTTITFARSLLYSRARKQDKAEAKRQLLKEIDGLLRNIKSKSKQFLNVGEAPEAMLREPIKAAFVRHSGQSVIDYALLEPLKALHEEIEKL